MSDLGNNNVRETMRLLFEFGGVGAGKGVGLLLHAKDQIPAHTHVIDICSTSENCAQALNFLSLKR